MTWSWKRLCADVEDPLAGQPDRRESELEAGGRGLVAPGHLGRHHPVERDTEALVRRGEEVGVAVRDHAEPVPLVQPAQRVGRVGERGPVANRHREARDRLGCHGDAVVLGDAPQPGCEHLAVAPIRRPFGIGLVPGIHLEQCVVVDCLELRERGAETGEQPRLPVDQRPVAVEREDVEAVEGDCHALSESRRALRRSGRRGSEVAHRRALSDRQLRAGRPRRRRAETEPPCRPDLAGRPLRERAPRRRLLRRPDAVRYRTSLRGRAARTAARIETARCARA